MKNFIEEALKVLTEMSTELCNCGHKDSKDPEDHKKYCKAYKKFMGFDTIREGRMKRYLEDKVEKACTCGAGASLDPNEHDPKCKAQKYLTGDQGMSDEIDKAEYDRGDR